MLRTALTSLRYRTARLVLSSSRSWSRCRLRLRHPGDGRLDESGVLHQFRGRGQERRRRRDPACWSHRRAARTILRTASVLAQVRAARGVESAAGRLVGRAPLVGSGGKVIRNGELPGVGINVAGDPALRGFTVASGHLPGGPGQVAVDTSTAADEHFRLGQTVKVVDHTGRILSFRLVGTIDLGVDHEFGDSTVTAFRRPPVRRHRRSGYDQIVAPRGGHVAGRADRHDRGAARNVALSGADRRPARHVAGQRGVRSPSSSPRPSWCSR